MVSFIKAFQQQLLYKDVKKQLNSLWIETYGNFFLSTGKKKVKVHEYHENHLIMKY